MNRAGIVGAVQSRHSPENSPSLVGCCSVVFRPFYVITPTRLPHSKANSYITPKRGAALLRLILRFHPVAPLPQTNR
jgi:hypothetical protein